RRAQTEAARADRNASQEAAQRRQAEDAALEVRKTLAASDFLQATRLIAEDKSPDALAYLQRCLSLDPSNLAALTRLTSLLAYRKWMMPLFSLKGSNAVNSALFSPDGNQILTTSPEGTLRVWDAHNGQPLTEPIGFGGTVSSTWTNFIHPFQFSPDS